MYVLIRASPKRNALLQRPEKPMSRQKQCIYVTELNIPKGRKYFLRI